MNELFDYSKKHGPLWWVCVGSWLWVPLIYIGLFKIVAKIVGAITDRNPAKSAESPQKSGLKINISVAAIAVFLLFVVIGAAVVGGSDADATDSNSAGTATTAADNTEGAASDTATETETENRAETETESSAATESVADTETEYVHIHSWKGATCVSPATCSGCGETDGKALGHQWKEANCTTPKTCSRCGEINGKALGHSWGGSRCDFCGAENPNAIETEAEELYILNTNTMKFHTEYCRSIKDIKPENKDTHRGTRDDVIAMGYSPCGICHP